MDAVITFVNGLDPVWQADYEKYIGAIREEKRFRDWGTLKYLLRGIETCMPFIDNVFLVVSSESQVPSWADRSHLRIVLHKDIIPQKLLPVFNSCTIEMFLHRISGLDEEFIYFNDDMFPLGQCDRSDFFRNGCGVIGMSKSFFALNMYKRQCQVSDMLAKKALGRKAGQVFVRPQHICSPMLLSSCTEAFKAVESDILMTASRTRMPENPNQYFYLDYMYYTGKIIPEKISNKHLSQAVYSAGQISDFIKEPSAKMACINDVEMSDDKYEDMRRGILTAFETRFPEKSRFEL